MTANSRAPDTMAAAEQSIAVARVLARRVKSRDAQLRRTFVRRRSQARETPLMQMLRGGRGGEVRLKLYLSFLWMSVAPPHTTTYPARTWATLLGLPQPETLGARRINDAVDWLQKHEFVAVTGRRGLPKTVQLLEDTGSGRPYTLPGARIAELTAKHREWTRHLYDKVPVALWTRGWLALLNGPAIACLLLLLANQGRDQPVWFSQSVLEERYDMSPDTRQRGMQTLEDWGIIRVVSEVLSRTSADFQRLRNTYELVLSRLDHPPLLTERPSESSPQSQQHASDEVTKRARSKPLLTV